MTKYIDSDDYQFSFSDGKLISDNSDVSPYLEKDFLADEIKIMIDKLYNNSNKIKPLSNKELKTLYYLLKSANEIIS
jgi:hypothetical protein